MKKLIFAFIFITMAVLSVGRPALAQTEPACDSTKGYCLLTPIPLNGASSNPTGSVDINSLAGSYIPGVIKLVIGLAGGIAVIMIMVGGVEYITSATGMGKSDGKDRIYNAIIGLVLVISAYTILFTINPNLVKLDFSGLKPAAQGPALLTSTSSTIPKDSSGITPPCANCVPVNPSQFPQKAPGVACSNPVCDVSATMAGKLENLTTNFDPTLWWVTEMYPPTVSHISGCHNDGTCVDAALKVSNPSPALIAAFLTAIKKTGFSSYVYEACDNKQGFTTARLTELTSSPVLKGFNIQCEPTTAGENAHINQ